MSNSSTESSDVAIDVAIVGAGFAGMYMLHRLRGLGYQARVFEAGKGVGGTWYWNRYPGARCDIPSMEYSYQFSEALQQEWEWTEKYATQDEILRYANHVAERFDLFKDMRFNVRVTQALYDETRRRWQVKLNPTDTASDSAAQTVDAQFVVMATGCLSVPNFPNIQGLDEFDGEVLHTGQWPHEGVDLEGRRVAVVGTGSSAIQSLPIIAAEASEVFVFQRTPNYSIPARNAPLDPAYVTDIKSRYREFREDNWTRGFGANFRDNDQSAFDVDDAARRLEYEERWAAGGLAFLAAFNDLVFDDAANGTAQAFFAEKIAEKVEDPDLAGKLTPSTPIGCKRLCVDTDYYQTFNLDHVHLVDLQDAPLTHITGNAVCTTSAACEVDTIVLATGFDAMTGAVTRIDIRGVEGQTLRDKWADGPRTYLGLATHGFPNLFLITGPGSPSVLSNMLPSIEQHVEWIADCIDHVRKHQYASIGAERSAEDDWVDHVNETAGLSIYPNCNSWYLGANVEGKKRVFMPYLGVPPYIEKCAEVVADGYKGFALKA